LNPKTSIRPLLDIATAILIVRGEMVILDVDLAATFGVTTKLLERASERLTSRLLPTGLL
jgi:hypothetical protein